MSFGNVGDIIVTEVFDTSSMIDVFSGAIAVSGGLVHLSCAI